MHSGPFLFDTSAESWFARTDDPQALDWMRAYLSRHQIHISAVTVLERARGYSLLWHKARPDGLARIEAARISYLNGLGIVWPIDAATAVVAGEIMAMIPTPPTPPRRSHRLAESHPERLARWRFDGLIAATALVAGMPLVHNNAADFEAIRTGIECAPQRFPRVGSLELLRCTALAVVS